MCVYPSFFCIVIALFFVDANLKLAFVFRDRFFFNQNEFNVRRANENVGYFLWRFFDF